MICCRAVVRQHDFSGTETFGAEQLVLNELTGQRSSLACG